MKKIISLLLVVVMALSMAACSSGVETAIEKADELYAAGDYAGALNTLVAADDYTKLNEKINAARLAQYQADNCNIIGTWVNVEGTVKYSFNEDFTGTYTSMNTGAEQSLDYVITDDNRIHITYPVNVKLSFIQEDGLNKLINETGSAVYVSEADYELFVPDVIEITMDNWSDYFDLRECNQIYTNNFGEISSFYVGYGLFLKDEYISRLKGIHDVSFQIEADVYFCAVDYDGETGDYTVGERYADDSWMFGDNRRNTFNGSVYDYTKQNPDPRSDCYMQVCGIVTYGSTMNRDGIYYTGVFGNVELLRVQGSIEIAK